MEGGIRYGEFGCGRKNWLFGYREVGTIIWFDDFPHFVGKV
jgi:hypothetical protein